GGVNVHTGDNIVVANIVVANIVVDNIVVANNGVAVIPNDQGRESLAIRHRDADA
ncbi:MAG: hypothetical protein ACI9C4_003141, partial [Paraglaciecola sp.]